jgi:hypothetical protein
MLMFFPVMENGTLNRVRMQNHENHTLYEGSPLQGFFEARRAGFFLNLFVTGPPRGALFWGGGIHRTG